MKKETNNNELFTDLTNQYQNEDGTFSFGFLFKQFPTNQEYQSRIDNGFYKDDEDDEDFMDWLLREMKKPEDSREYEDLCTVFGGHTLKEAIDQFKKHPELCEHYVVDAVETWAKDEDNKEIKVSAKGPAIKYLEADFGLNVTYTN